MLSRQISLQIYNLEFAKGRDEKRSLQSTKKTPVVNVDGQRQPHCTFQLVDIDQTEISWSTSTRPHFFEHRYRPLEKVQFSS